MESKLVQVYADFTKKMGALIDLNYYIEEEDDMADLNLGEEIVEEEAGWYIEDINAHLTELRDLCHTVPDNQRLTQPRHIQYIITFVENWELGKWAAEYAEYSKYSSIPIMTKP